MKPLILISTILLTFSSMAKNISRYPYTNFAYSNYQLGVYNENKGVIPLAASVNVDTDFNLGQLELLNKSMDFLLKFSMDEKVLDCAYEKSTKDMPSSRTTFIEQLYSVFTWRHLNGLFYPGNIYIAKVFDAPDIVGVGYVNLFYDTNNPLPGFLTRRYIHVGINGDYLSSKNYLYQKPEYWAGVIAHEMLHNLGYTHTTGYKGSFINEYGDCLWSVATNSKKHSQISFGELVVNKENTSK